jgi:hypothetical protein
VGVRPAHLVDGPVDVVEQDLGDAGPAAGRGGAEVGQPAVVGVQPGPTQVQVAGRGPRWLLDQRRPGEERRHGVGEDHLGHDAVGLELGQPAVAVPVAVGIGVAQVVVGVGEVRAPGVELAEQPAFEVRPVVGDVATAMAVGGDHRVALVGHENPLPTVVDTAI